MELLIIVVVFLTIMASIGVLYLSYRHGLENSKRLDEENMRNRELEIKNKDNELVELIHKATSISLTQYDKGEPGIRLINSPRTIKALKDLYRRLFNKEDECALGTHTYNAVLSKPFKDSMYNIVDGVKLLGFNNKNNNNAELYSLTLNNPLGSPYNALLLCYSEKVAKSKMKIPEYVSHYYENLEDTDEVDVSIFTLVYEANENGDPTTPFKAHVFSSLEEQYKYVPVGNPYRVPVFKTVENTNQYSGVTTQVVMDKTLSKVLSTPSNDIFISDTNVLSFVYPKISTAVGDIGNIVDLEELTDVFINAMKSQITFLLFGIPGQGKSYLGNYLISKIPERDPKLFSKYDGVIIETSLEKLFNNIEHGMYDNHIVFMDDIDLSRNSLSRYDGNPTEYLKKLFNGPINISRNIAFIITTNTQEVEIPGELLRAGRTIRAHIGTLNKEEFKKAVNALKLYRTVDTPMYEELIRIKNKFLVADVFAAAAFGKSEDTIDTEDMQESEKVQLPDEDYIIPPPVEPNEIPPSDDQQ